MNSFLHNFNLRQLRTARLLKMIQIRYSISSALNDTPALKKMSI